MKGITRASRYRLAASMCCAALLSLLAGSAPAAPPSYLKLSVPQVIDWPHQDWEGDQQPHTLTVIEMNKDGFKYWGWYGLNNGRGVGLGRSNDLIHWVKYEKNPLWLNARWPAAVKGADPAHPGTLYFAITRDYDTTSSRIVLASSEDGITLKEVKNLVAPVDHERNQNPSLMLDPVTHKFFLTFYRGNDENYFDIISKSAATVDGLDVAVEKRLMHTIETLAAPNLLYVPGKAGKGVYYLATEIFPGRYAKAKGEWQVKVFYADQADGDYKPTAGNPIETGERACLFQHEFNGRYYGFQSRLDHATDKWLMEVVTAPMAP